MRVLAALALGLAAAPCVARAADAPPAPPADPAVADFLATAAPTVVNLRYVLKTGDRERQQTAIGTMIDPSGLLVVGNDYLGGGNSRAVDLKVTFAGDPKDWGAVVVARDTVLSLAWVQVLGLEKPIPAVDLAIGTDPALGQDLKSVWRTSRGFDHAVAMGRHYVSSRVEKPRTMWSLSGDGVLVGSPVYDAAGKPVGVTATQSGSAGDEDGGSSATFLLPLADVRKSLSSAKAKVGEAIEKAKSSTADKPAEPAPAPSPTPDAPMDGGMAETPPSPEAPAPEMPK